MPGLEILFSEICEPIDVGLDLKLLGKFSAHSLTPFYQIVKHEPKMKSFSRTPG
jgi:hypothetical protein